MIYILLSIRSFGTKSFTFNSFNENYVIHGYYKVLHTLPRCTFVKSDKLLYIFFVLTQPQAMALDGKQNPYSLM